MGYMNYYLEAVNVLLSVPLVLKDLTPKYIPAQNKLKIPGKRAHVLSNILFPTRCFYNNPELGLGIGLSPRLTTLYQHVPPEILISGGISVSQSVFNGSVENTGKCM